MRLKHRKEGEQGGEGSKGKKQQDRRRRRSRNSCKNEMLLIQREAFESNENGKRNSRALPILAMARPLSPTLHGVDTFAGTARQEESVERGRRG